MFCSSHFMVNEMRAVFIWLLQHVNSSNKGLRKTLNSSNTCLTLHSSVVMYI